MACWPGEPLGTGVRSINAQHDAVVTQRTNHANRPVVGTRNYFLTLKTPIPYLPFAVCAFRSGRVQIVWLFRDDLVKWLPT